MRRTLLILAISTITTLALAGEQTGIVRMDHGQYRAGPESAGLTFFFVQGAAKINTPACNTYSDRWVINNSWPAAKIQIAILLSAITSGKTVTVRGQGECSEWANSETATDIRLNN
jgi:hypothetical protein